MPELEVLDVQKEQTAVYLISLSLYIYICGQTLYFGLLTMLI